MTFEVFYISIHAPRAGSDERLALRNSVVIAISIHAPRAGSDVVPPPLDVLRDISIHAPRAGSDYGVAVADVYADVFQSTLPVRGATR